MECLPPWPRRLLVEGVLGVTDLGPASDFWRLRSPNPPVAAARLWTARLCGTGRRPDAVHHLQLGKAGARAARVTAGGVGSSTGKPCQGATPAPAWAVWAARAWRPPRRAPSSPWARLLASPSSSRCPGRAPPPDAINQHLLSRPRPRSQPQSRSTSACPARAAPESSPGSPLLAPATTSIISSSRMRW